jgi:hypothetical protein
VGEAPPAIPADWDAVTPTWMSAALAASYPGVEVAEVTLLLRDDGTNRRARFGLTYAAGSGPATVFLKAADPAHAAVNARMGGLFNEPRLFLSGVPIPVDHPDVHCVLMDEPGLDFLLVMEDVAARGADPRDSTRPFTYEQAAEGVRGLARFHRSFWGERLTREPALSWVQPLVAWTGMAVGIDIGLKRAGDTVPVEVRALTGEEIESGHWATYVVTVGSGSQTLLHGDAHIGNTYALPDGGVGFLDWQVVRRGHSTLDLGYFLQGAVTTEDRRTGEAALIDAYLEALDLPDDEQPSREETWLRYRASAAHGLALWLATAASNTWQRPEVSLTLAQRYAAAFVDLDTVGAIAELGDR